MWGSGPIEEVFVEAVRIANKDVHQGLERFKGDDPEIKKAKLLDQGCPQRCKQMKNL